VTTADNRTPDTLRYTADHEWVDRTGDAAVRIGITFHAQDALGDIVYVQLPEPGTAVVAGQPLGEVESTKSVSDVYAPVTGTVTARNDALEGAPELINSDPYGGGWLLDITLADAASVDGLLDAEAYRGLTST
jgi:glycine cleavage system H protein